MTMLLKTVARAYVYAGDWVADCPRPGCGNVDHLYLPIRKGGPRTVQAPSFHCTYCGMDAVIEWPSDMGGLMEVLMLRPIPHTRNWYPADHETAVRFRIEHGQSVQQLREENAANGVEPR